MRATVNGYVTNLNLEVGDYESPGKPMFALIDSDSYYVNAYFEETKIPQIAVGAPVAIRLMNGAPELRGSVEGVARGVTDYDNRDGPELLDNVNPTFTWVRLAQRVPVRIRLTNVPPDVIVSAGMTCTVVLKDGAHLADRSERETHFRRRSGLACWPTRRKRPDANPSHGFSRSLRA